MTLRFKIREIAVVGICRFWPHLLGARVIILEVKPLPPTMRGVKSTRDKTPRK